MSPIIDHNKNITRFSIYDQFRQHLKYYQYIQSKRDIVNIQIIKNHEVTTCKAAYSCFISNMIMDTIQWINIITNIRSIRFLYNCMKLNSYIIILECQRTICYIIYIEGLTFEFIFNAETFQFQYIYDTKRFADYCYRSKTQITEFIVPYHSYSKFVDIINGVAGNYHVKAAIQLYKNNWCNKRYVWDELTKIIRNTLQLLVKDMVEIVVN